MDILSPPMTLEISGTYIGKGVGFFKQIGAGGSKNSSILEEGLHYLDPITGQGNFAIVVNVANRDASLDLLYEHNLIKGLHRGY